MQGSCHRAPQHFVCHSRLSLKCSWIVPKLTMTLWLLLMSTGVLRSLFGSKGVLLAKLLETGHRLEVQNLEP